VTRDELVSRAELAGLTADRLALDLKQAEQQATLEQIQELLASQSEIQQRAAEADDRLWRSLAEHEGALEGLLSARLELRRLNGRLHQLGYTGDALQLCPPPRVPEYKRRIGALEQSYGNATHPLGVIPVRGQFDGTNG
jgi:hypothetical protein